MRLAIGLLLAAGVLAALTGCVQPDVEPVKIMVPVPCITERPAEPTYPKIEADDGLFVRVQKLLAERELRIAYEGELKAVLSACE